MPCSSGVANRRRLEFDTHVHHVCGSLVGFAVYCRHTDGQAELHVLIKRVMHKHLDTCTVYSAVQSGDLPAGNALPDQLCVTCLHAGAAGFSGVPPKPKLFVAGLGLGPEAPKFLRWDQPVEVHDVALHDLEQQVRAA